MPEKTGSILTAKSLGRITPVMTLIPMIPSFASRTLESVLGFSKMWMVFLTNMQRAVIMGTVTVAATTMISVVHVTV